MAKRTFLSMALLAALVPLARGARSEAAHPLAYWVRADALASGPGAWSITVRAGGYYTGYAGWLEGEFSGSLSEEQRDELKQLLERLPRRERSYRFGTELLEAPGLSLQVHQPAPTTRFRVGVVGAAEASDPRVGAVAEVAEALLRLVPPGECQPFTPWRGR